MDLLKTIKESIAKLNTDGSCSTNVDDVEETLANVGIYGQRYLVQDQSGKNITRRQHSGELRGCPWHEVYILNQPELVVDLDSPMQVYKKDMYFDKCLVQPNKPVFAYLEES